MDLSHFIDQIAATANREWNVISQSYRIIPISPDEDGRLLLLTEAPLDAAVKDDLKVLLGTQVRDHVIDTDTFDRLLAFLLSRRSTRGDDSEFHGEIDCEVTFKFKCPQDWMKLSPTGDRWARHCAVCSRNVVLCGNDAQIAAAKRVGACIAIAKHDKRESSGFLLGITNFDA